MQSAHKIMKYIKPWLAAHSRLDRPMFIGISGPQGSGKSTLAQNLVDQLAGTKVRAVAMSLDDYYLTHAELQALKQTNPQNTLIQGRGLPGTHAIDYLLETLAAFKDPKLYPITIPVYDKSANEGLGDRSPTQFQVVNERVSLVILEGWMMGFKAPQDPATLEKAVSPDLVQRFGFKNLVDVVCHRLPQYGRVYDEMDHFIHWTPQRLDYVYGWRTEQERQLRDRRGMGMSDDQVREFVDRYVPLYQVCTPYLYNHRVWGSVANKPGSVHLRVSIDVNRLIESIDMID